MSWNRLRIRLPWLGVPLVLWVARPNLLSLELGGVLGVTGLMVRAWAAGTIIKQHQLTTWGPYAYTRNPLYLGSFLMGLGIAVATAQPLLVAATLFGFWLLYARTMRSEERTLEALHGDAFREYRDAVPAFLPRLTPYRVGQRDHFHLDRYLRHREYQAALGMIALLAALVAEYVF
jgi:protein-S-isoprenylcysteine O-methyltransferase Ste14